MIRPLDTNHSNSLMRGLAMATELLSKQWNIAVQIREWERDRATHHYYRFTGKHSISYSQISADYCFHKGYTEYATLQGRIPNCNGGGWYGIYLLATHEFGHALQYSYPNGRPRGSAHNEYFIDAVRRIREQWPYKEFAALLGLSNLEPQVLEYTRPLRRVETPEIIFNMPTSSVKAASYYQAAASTPAGHSKLLGTISQAALDVGVRYQQVYQLVQKGKITKHGELIDINEVRQWARMRTRRS